MENNKNNIFIKMRKLLPILILSLVSFVGFSQNSKTAKDLLDEVAKKVESYKNIEIEFTHNLDNVDGGVHQETRGKVTVKGDLYHLNYMGTEQIFDGKKVYLLIPEDEEVVIKQPNSDDASTLTPSKMLTFYEKGFTYEMDIVQKIKGTKIQFVKLTPTNTESELKYVLVGINKKTKHIYKVIETGKDDTLTTYTLTKFTTNNSLPSSLFTFNRASFEEKGYSISEPK